MLAVNLSPRQACRGSRGQGGQGLLRRPSTLQSHPISAPMGTAPWPPHGSSSLRSHLLPWNGTPLASEATTLHLGAVPSPRSALGFPGRHVLIHIIGLFVVLIWTSCRGGMCFFRDLLCGSAGQPSVGSHGHTQTCSSSQSSHLGLSPQMPQNSPKEKAAVDGVSVPVLGFARDLSCPGSRASGTPSM